MIKWTPTYPVTNNIGGSLDRDRYSSLRESLEGAVNEIRECHRV